VREATLRERDRKQACQGGSKKRVTGHMNPLKSKFLGRRKNTRKDGLNNVTAVANNPPKLSSLFTNNREKRRNGHRFSRATGPWKRIGNKLCPPMGERGDKEWEKEKTQVSLKCQTRERNRGTSPGIHEKKNY